MNTKDLDRRRKEEINGIRNEWARRDAIAYELLASQLINRGCERISHDDGVGGDTFRKGTLEVFLCRPLGTHNWGMRELGTAKRREIFDFE